MQRSCDEQNRLADQGGLSLLLSRVTSLPISPSPDSGHPLDPDQLRPDFPALQQQVHGRPLIYLDNAATTQKPRSVLEAMDRFYQNDNANVHRGVHELAHRATNAFEGARERVRRFVNAGRESEIVFTRGTTESVNLVASGWGETQLQPGDEILLTEMEHHSNLVPWQRIARKTGARLVFWPLDPTTGTLRLDAVDRCFSKATRLLAFTHVSNVLGTVNPADWLCAQARERGVLSLVDAAQSASHLPIDVQQMGCDFLAFSGHKAWGPTGIGVLYGRQAELERMEPWQGGGEMIEHVDWQESTYAAPPQRFEAGTPNIAGAIGLHAALDALQQQGLERIHAYDRQLTRHALTRLQEIPGIRILGSAEDRCGVISFTLEGVHAHDLVTFANEQGIALRGGHHCAQPLLRLMQVESAVRASTHAYNTVEELDQLATMLLQARKLFT